VGLLNSFMPKIFGRKKKQIGILIGEDGHVRKENYTIPGPGFVVDSNETGAWHLVNSLMLKITGMQRYVLIFTERNTVPYNPFVTIPPKTLEKIQSLDSIAGNSTSPMLKTALKNSRNNLLVSGLVICVCAVVFVFLVFVGFNWWKNGGRLPF